MEDRDSLSEIVQPGAMSNDTGMQRDSHHLCLAFRSFGPQTVKRVLEILEIGRSCSKPLAIHVESDIAAVDGARDDE